MGKAKEFLNKVDSNSPVSEDRYREGQIQDVIDQYDPEIEDFFRVQVRHAAGRPSNFMNFSLEEMQKLLKLVKTFKR